MDTTMISPPDENKKRQVTRALLEALIGTVPIGGFLVRIYQETHPPAMRAKVSDWMQEISGTVNEHSQILDFLTDRLAPTIIISESATTIGLNIARHSTNGLCDPIEFDSLVSQLPEFTTSQVENGVYELKSLGLLTTRGALGIPLARIRPTDQLFWTFDLPAFGYNYESDAVELAKSVLEDSSLESARSLEQRMGWPRRRLNPALSRFLQFVSPNLISNEIQAEYTAESFSLQNEDRYRLKQFIAEASQNVAQP